MAGGLTVAYRRLKSELYLVKEAVFWVTKRDFGRYRLEGTAKAAPGGPLSLVFVGRESVVNDFAQIFFDGHVNIASDGEWARRRAELALNEAPIADIMIREHPPLSRRAPAGSFLHQSLVDAIIPLTQGFDHWFNNVLKKQAKRRQVKALEAGYTVSVSTDARDLRFFYERLLTPSAIALHGERASVPPIAVFEKLWVPGALMFAKDKDGTIVGGKFILMSRVSEWRFLRVAMTLDVQENGALRSMVTTLLDVEAIRVCCQAGQTSISMGMAPASSVAGLWAHKAEWGAVPRRPIPWYPVCAVWAKSPRGQQVLDAHKLFRLRDGSLEIESPPEEA